MGLGLVGCMGGMQMFDFKMSLRSNKKKTANTMRRFWNLDPSKFTM